VEDIGLLYVVSEETDHSGMIKANDLGKASVVVGGGGAAVVVAVVAAAVVFVALAVAVAVVALASPYPKYPRYHKAGRELMRRKGNRDAWSSR